MKTFRALPLSPILVFRQWAVPAAVAAFLAGRRPGRTRSAVLALVALLSAGVLLLSVVPARLPWGSRATSLTPSLTA